MRRTRPDPAAELARTTTLLVVEVRHRLYARRPTRSATDSDRRESVIASEVLEEAAPGIGVLLAAANRLLERRIAARNRAKGDKPAANGGSGST